MKKNLIISKTHTVIALLLVCCVVLIAASSPTVPTEQDIAYPEGFRGWVHVKTGLTPRGFHHIYANSTALEGYKTGKFLDGSVIVFDLIEATVNNTNTNEGKRRLVDVMVRNTKLYSATGGWGYEEFRGDSKTDRTIRTLAATSCYNCHATQKTNDNVFSRLRD